MKKFLYMIVCIGMLLGLSPALIGTTAKATVPDGISPINVTFASQEVGYSSISAQSIVLNIANASGTLSYSLSDAGNSFVLEGDLQNKTYNNEPLVQNFTIKPKDDLPVGSYTSLITMAIGNDIKQDKYYALVSFTVTKKSSQNINYTYIPPISNSYALQSFTGDVSFPFYITSSYFAAVNPESVEIYGSLSNGTTTIESTHVNIKENNDKTKPLVFSKDDLNSLGLGTYTMSAYIKENSSNEARTAEQLFTIVISEPYAAISLNPSTDKIFDSTTIGYSNQTSYTISVKNDGNAATGDLAVSLSGTNADSFILSKVAIPSIAASDSDTFTVVPKTGLAIGTYVAAVNVAKGQENPNDLAAKQINISFTVTSADDKPTKKDDFFLVTFLDSKGNTVKVEWVKYGGNATAPTGYGTYNGYTNVTAHMDLKPIGTANASNGYNVPNTADKKASE